MLPTSTYRLQVRPSFDLHAVADLCDYLSTLGVGAVYLSPLLPSAKGSDHGYDVVAFDTVDPARGGLDAWTRAVAAARARGLGIVVDIVPNHAGVARAYENAAWWDVLARGPESEFAQWFDVEWAQGRLKLPVLGDDFSPDQLSIVHGELRYFEHRFPIAEGTGPHPGDTPADVHDRQFYELVNFRRADTDQSYRRFFAVVSLAGLRVEDEHVFDATHDQIRAWVQRDGVGGLRVDHPDGLADPLDYMRKLRELAGKDAWIVVEKILEPGERLPAEWPVDGTTGYDALAEVGALFIDPAGESPMDALYRELTGDESDSAAHVRRGKRLAVQTILQAEVLRLARLAPDVEDAEEALAELLVAFPVYRSYMPAGAHHLAAAVDTARVARPDLGEAIDKLATRLGDPADELCVRFQQTSGAVMAKGVEDTGFYRYNRFIALNEVGCDPSSFGIDVGRFHALQQSRQQSWPRSMTTLSTHDTKRSEDVRARLAVLAELPDEWASAARSLMSAAPVPDPGFGYLLWQTFVGAGFIGRDRMHAYAEKAMREAAVGTTWIDPNEAFESAVHAAVDAAYDRADVHEPLLRMTALVERPGWSNSLGQKLVQLTMPGVPDVYQGTEMWDDSLVDPDNRRPVDFDYYRYLLDELDGSVEPPPVDADGRAKMWLTARTLRLRRDWPELFCTYTPVPVRGAAARHAVAFDRGGAITVATRLPVGLERGGGWGDAVIELGGSATDVISGVRYEGEVPLTALLAAYPVALLVR